MSNDFITITQLAEHHNVPVQAVLNAIKLNRIRTEGLGGANIPGNYLTDYKFDLIGIYEYADRKGVTFPAIYKRVTLGQMLYTVDPISDIMKIDWELYKDERFRSFSFKYRKKNK